MFFLRSRRLQSRRARFVVPLGLSRCVHVFCGLIWIQSDLNPSGVSQACPRAWACGTRGLCLPRSQGCVAGKTGAAPTSVSACYAAENSASPLYRQGPSLYAPEGTYPAFVAPSIQQVAADVEYLLRRPGDLGRWRRPQQLVLYLAPDKTAGVWASHVAAFDIGPSV